MTFIRTPLAAALCALLVAAAPALRAAPLDSGIDLSNVDPTVRVQDDLYQHVNGAWLKKATFPPDKAYIGAGEEMVETTRNELRGLIEDVQRTGKPAYAQKVGDLYASFMDEAALDKLGARPLAARLAEVDAVTDRSQLVALLARQQRLGVDTPLAFAIGQDDRNSSRYVPGFWQSGIGLPDRDYYLKEDDAKFRELRVVYERYMARALELAGDKDSVADAHAVMALETEIAKVQLPRADLRDPVKNYNRVDLGDLPKLAPAVDWTAYLQAAGLTGRTPDVLVGQPTYLTGVSGLLQGQPLASWKAYARVHLLQAFAPYLSKDFVDARFAFISALRGTTENAPRWKRGIAVVDASVGEMLGQLYVEKYFPPSSKERMDKLVGNLLEAYRQSIETLDWMSPETKKAAQAKLAKINVKIGYPKRWIDYSKLEIKRDDLAGNVARATDFEYERNLAKLGKPIDRDEWGMTPQTINAYYNPGLNEIVFPAAFLQPPEFFAHADDAVNYGSIGAVIGHEISHGFDDNGSQYDGDGNLRDWWTKQDRERFEAKTKALVAQYSAFVPVPGYPVNGEVTLGENIADNSGLAIAWKAYHLSLGGKPAPVIDGLSGDQRFFLGYAQSWRSKQRDGSLVEQIKSDPHTPDEFRVLGTVRNLPGFYATFGVKPGDRMYLPPDQRVQIW
ncbi:MAG: M13 family metallopeptidase [Proteobacteria bacterium]|nr:M13 family metallopeptidase [Pseudomonadota bacterium]